MDSGSLGSTYFSPHTTNRNVIEEPQPEKSAWTPRAKWLTVAFIVGGVAGIVIVAIGATNLFGLPGSTGFIASITTGSVFTGGAIGGIIWIAITSYQNHKKENGPSRQQGTPRKDFFTEFADYLNEKHPSNTPPLTPNTPNVPSIPNTPATPTPDVAVAPPIYSPVISPNPEKFVGSQENI